MTKTLEWLDLNRPQSKEETPSGLSLQNTFTVKEQLLKELLELEKQAEVLKRSDQGVDFSMLQTYKEMIHSRQVYFSQLSR